MGCGIHLVVAGRDPTTCADALRYAEERIEHLESRWSRFRASSEISKLNTHRGVPVVVSPDTFRLVETAARACDETAGRYDPTIIDAICSIGYDRDFPEVTKSAAFVAHIGKPAPGCAGIRLDPYLNAVSLGTGVGFDPGGIGKGLAADIVVRELLDSGVDGVMVNLGGDVAAAGDPPDDHGWIVGIEDPYDATHIVGRVTLESGGVCTSSRIRRAWQSADGRHLHHIVDPRTGNPVATSLLTATVVAGSAWQAEALTKALFVASGELKDFGTDHYRSLLGSAYACCIDDKGEVTTFGDRHVFDLESDRVVTGTER